MECDKGPGATEGYERNPSYPQYVLEHFTDIQVEPLAVSRSWK